MNRENLKAYLEKQIADIKHYLKINGRKEDEDGFSPSEDLQICNIAKNTIDLEEQLGCPLEVIHKAMMNGFYDSKTHTFYDSKNYDIKYCVDRDGFNYARIEAYEDISKINNNIYTLKCCIDVWCSDYKKTWWLKEDKSE